MSNQNSELAPVFEIAIDVEPEDVPQTLTADVRAALEKTCAKLKSDGLIIDYTIKIRSSPR